MEDVSLFILDVVQNSITAMASIVEIEILEDSRIKLMTVTIKDDGKGMDSGVLEKVADPFYTTRTTRKVGLGLPMFKAAAESCGGSFLICSLIGKGTEVRADFRLDNIDCPPLGKMEHTMVALIITCPGVDFSYKHSTDKGSVVLDTREIKKEIKELQIDHPEVIEWIRQYIVQGINEIDGGKTT